MQILSIRPIALQFTYISQGHADKSVVSSTLVILKLRSTYTGDKKAINGNRKWEVLRYEPPIYVYSDAAIRALPANT